MDEPTAGVDVELAEIDVGAGASPAGQETGVTVILTTHYIEEAEEMADRIGVINKGRLIITETKDALMKKMGKRQMVFTLREPHPDHSAEFVRLSLLRWRITGTS